MDVGMNNNKSDTVCVVYEVQKKQKKKWQSTPLCSSKIELIAAPRPGKLTRPSVTGGRFCGRFRSDELLGFKWPRIEAAWPTTAMDRAEMTAVISLE